MIGEQITQHDKVWINEAGVETCAPSSSDRDAFKRVKPLNERTIRPDGMPPKSWAETYREQRVQMESNLDEESLAAMEVLRSKGIIK